MIVAEPPKEWFGHFNREARGQGGKRARESSQDAQQSSQDVARRCTVCTQDRPQLAFSPIQWAGKKSGNRDRRCLKCAPKTAAAGQRYCEQCDRARPIGEFGPNQDGKVVKSVS